MSAIKPVFRCAEKIVKQLEITAGSKQKASNMNVQIERLQNDIMVSYLDK